ncbi:hypothetical protein [Symmachiella macrocystis]|uniref:hypothetical protein n=1 Tax=Symmachiella macrocystis TaxID=2527985 RepID=UPI0011B84982|nr:hypothetical protein [Symmachiella macrocystis]
MSTLERAARILAKAINRSSGERVEYVRDASSVLVSAVPGSTGYEHNQTNGITLRVKVRDFLITAADLVIGETLILPERGDVVRHTVCDEVLIFEVLDMGGGSHYVPSDPWGTILRVHCKQTGTEAVE